jgi:hypothetical protein
MKPIYVAILLFVVGCIVLLLISPAIPTTPAEWGKLTGTAIVPSVLVWAGYTNTQKKKEGEKT